MELSQTVILALIQGLTEFLPISSSAHLILVPLLTERPDQGLAFDVALNTATWLAVVIYMRGDIRRMLAALAGGSGREAGEAGGANPDRRLALMALAATVPVAAAGYLAHDLVAERLRTLEVIAWSSIVWGVMLWIADRRPGSKDVSGAGWAGALFIGAAQAVSLVPGTSRSGITMTAGLFAGLSRTAAVRFSFLLAVVVGALAGASEMAEMLKAGMDTPWPSVAVGFVVAFIAAYAAIHYFLKFISHASMTPFVIYRVLLGAVLLMFFNA